ncbi:hypothetical protein EV182_001364, partial [Spiromyces aspiralis]
DSPLPASSISSIGLTMDSTATVSANPAEVFKIGEQFGSGPSSSPSASLAMLSASMPPISAAAIPVNPTGALAPSAFSLNSIDPASTTADGLMSAISDSFSTDISSSLPDNALHNTNIFASISSQETAGPFIATSATTTTTTRKRSDSGVLTSPLLADVDEEGGSKSNHGKNNGSANKGGRSDESRSKSTKSSSNSYSGADTTTQSSATGTSSSPSSGIKRKNSFSNDESDERRRKFLERNRIAAFKCRQKKKAWIKELEQRAEEATIQNRNLHITVAQLKEEVLVLKNQLLVHQNCNCNMVHQYLHPNLAIPPTAAPVIGNGSTAAAAAAAAAAVAAGGNTGSMIGAPIHSSQVPLPANDPLSAGTTTTTATTATTTPLPSSSTAAAAAAAVAAATAAASMTSLPLSLPPPSTTFGSLVSPNLSSIPPSIIQDSDRI